MRVSFSKALCFVVCFWLVGCSSEDTQMTEVSLPNAEQAIEFVTNYKLDMIHAVNEGDFNELEPYLVTNNSFYHSIRRYVNDLKREQATKSLQSFEVNRVFKGESKWFVDVHEVVVISEYGQEKKHEREVRFELTKDTSESFRIVTIKQQR
ncbi:TcaA NTF2-like domain-containing protein [Bacillus solitudinis]|uniref:TcaA NTF2-like domain-containing protein n=1 Tax=Bacillus solitudinis TaxID=2014074 RepID=UPI000C24FABD|nr:hypothetical protein [Bacillus solitudinis]